MMSGGGASPRLDPKTWPMLFAARLTASQTDKSHGTIWNRTRIESHVLKRKKGAKQMDVSRFRVQCLVNCCRRHPSTRGFYQV